MKRIAAPSPARHAFTFASLVDNQSGDAIFVPGVVDIVE